MPNRGLYGFAIQPTGNLVDNDANFELLRKLLRDGSIINGKFGPGNAGDFDYSSWHIFCHLAGGSAVFDSAGQKLWAGLAHKELPDAYEASVVFRDGGNVSTVGLETEAGRAKLAQSIPLGFIEGSSAGHVLARGTRDPKTSYNGWLRQDFDHSTWSNKEGGTVWEHWCTTRDLRQTNVPGDSLLRGYLTLVSAVGGRFISAVARGRRSHEHPLQLCALVKAGFLTAEEAAWETAPLPIPAKIQRLLYEARPGEYLKAAEILDWPRGPQPSYFMFKRCINLWSPSSAVRADMTSFGL
ncbi:MAG: hypothetical protein ABSG19_00210 [Candidatus Aminicenantales bacterium]